MSRPTITNTRLTQGRDFAIRLARDSDEALIRDSWRRSYSMPWSDFALSPNLDVYMNAQSMAMDLALASCVVRVACAPDDEDQIIGWIAFHARLPVCHYVYVKDFARGRGIARALWQEAFGDALLVYATHVHTVTLPTRLVSRQRRDKDGTKRQDHERPVPTWRKFGTKIVFSPWMVFAP